MASGRAWAPDLGVSVDRDRRPRRRDAGEAGRARVRRRGGRPGLAGGAPCTGPVTGRANKLDSAQRGARAAAPPPWDQAEPRRERPERRRDRRRPRAGARPAADRRARADPRGRRGRRRGVRRCAAGGVGGRGGRRLRSRAGRARTRPPWTRPASRSRRRTTRPTSSDTAAGRLAVTKALTAVDPDNPELAAAQRCGDPGRAVAAGRRRRGRRPPAVRARRDARQEHLGGLAGPCPRHRRSRPRRVRGRAAAARAHGHRPAGHGPPWRR